VRGNASGQSEVFSWNTRDGVLRQKETAVPGSQLDTVKSLSKKGGNSYLMSRGEALTGSSASIGSCLQTIIPVFGYCKCRESPEVPKYFVLLLRIVTDRAIS
jgi:hypothetical protein